MINGMSPSSIDVVKKARESHYRKLQEIIHRQNCSLSQLEPTFVSLINNRRGYHVIVVTIRNVGVASRRQV